MNFRKIGPQMYKILRKYETVLPLISRERKIIEIAQK